MHELSVFNRNNCYLISGVNKLLLYSNKKVQIKTNDYTVTLTIWRVMITNPRDIME